MVMIESNNKLFAPKDGWVSFSHEEQKRLQILSELGLRQPETIPVFEEATQSAAHFLEAPISILGFMDQDIHWFKSAVGLSRLGLMNNLAQTRQMSRRESFCSQVVETSQVVVINDTKELARDLLVDSPLLQQYGIRAYLGAPLIDATGHCLGALAVMDLVPRTFTRREIEFLQIIARWSMSEFERNRLLQAQPEKTPTKTTPTLALQPEHTVELKITTPTTEECSDTIKPLKLELLSQLTHELRTPLTSVLGMASVLGREIYGPLTTKQKEYLEIIQHSGRYLLSLVNEITELGATDPNSHVLNLSPVDIEMMCQQAINSLDEIASRREQEVRLSIEPGRSRIWHLDKDKVRQMLYHLLFSVIQLSATGSVVRLHVSYKEDTLNMTVWVSHPWLGEGITDVDPYFQLNSLSILEMVGEVINYEPNSSNQPDTSNSWDSSPSYPDSVFLDDAATQLTKPSNNVSRERLGFLLSCQLAELHGGQIAIQGSSESGYRYVLSLPLQAPNSTEILNDIAGDR
jgi:signal transduction histidine kinase